MRTIPDVPERPVLTAMRDWMNGARVPPLDEQLRSFGQHYRSFRANWDRWPETNLALGMIEERHRFIAEFCFAVPNAEAIDLLLAHQPLLEIGAGTGAWAKLLRDRGADVIATDPRFERHFFDEQIDHAHYIEPGVVPWFDLQGKTAVRRWPERNVFCAWPSLGQTWLRQAARAMRPGRTLLVVYEDACADERTWDYLDHWRPVADQELIGWYHCHDRLIAWKKPGSRL
jgi:hypothetical protein